MNKPARKPRTPENSSEWAQVAFCRAVVSREVVQRQFASETVLLNIQTGQYYGMDSVAARFFATLQESTTVDAAVTVLAEEFEGTIEMIREDMVRFCDDLVQKGLIELSAPGA